MGHTEVLDAVIDASPKEIVDALTDFERYPEWQTGVTGCTVRERDSDGRGTLVEIAVDVKIRKIRYTARYWYDLEHGRLGFDLVEGDLKECRACYVLEPVGERATRVSMDITTEVGFYLPGPVKKLIRDQSLKNSMRDLKRRVAG